MTTPTGAPAWSRTASHDIYGGDVDKENLQSIGATNAKTDVGADAFVRACADLAADTRTAAFSKLLITCNDSVPGAPTIQCVHQMTGVRLTSYVGDAAPSGFPSASRNGNGDVTVTWAASYSDPYGVSEATNIQHVHTSPVGTTSFTATPERLSAVSIRVRCKLYPSGLDATDGSFELEVS